MYVDEDFDGVVGGGGDDGGAISDGYDYSTTADEGDGTDYSETAFLNFEFSNIPEFEYFLRNSDLKSKFCFLHLNVQRIADLSKFFNLKTYLSILPTKPKVFSAEETWIRDGTGGIYQIAGYKSYHCSRESNGAGIAIYYDENFSIEIIDEDNGPVSYVSFKLFREDDPKNFIIFTCVYMPKQSDAPMLETILPNLITRWRQRKHIIMGDFNINVSAQTALALRYINLIESFGFQIANNCITRPLSATIIDHTIVNFNEVVSVTLENDLSDHNGVFGFIDDPFNPPTRGKSEVSYRIIQFESAREYFSESLQNSDWSSMNGEEMLNFIQTSLREAIETNTTTKTYKRKNSDSDKDWINSEVVKLSSKKHRLLRKRRNRPWDISLQTKIENISREINELKLRLKIKNAETKFGKSVPIRERWRNLNEVLGRVKKGSEKIVLQEQEEIIEDPSLVADRFSDFFDVASAESTLNEDRAMSYTAQLGISETLFLWPTDAEEVAKIICDLKPKRSAGYDGLSCFVLKKFTDIISSPLATCINKCFEEQIYPKSLKIAKIIPIFKSGSKSSVHNFRPVSVLPSLNKVFEKIICLRIENFLLSKQFFYDRQFGYRKSMGTRNCVLEMLDGIYKAMDEGEVATGVFLDLSKAFDLVEHSLLLKKLESYGLRGAINNILKSYLTDREQFVRVNGVDSNRKPKTRGLPQGSCLGPLLYLLYTNDANQVNFGGKMYAFADDTTIIYTGSDFHSNCTVAQTDFDSLSRYFEANGLKLNMTKTRIVHFRPKRMSCDNARVLCGDVEAVRAKSLRYLGVELDENLDFSEHVLKLCKKIRPWVAIIYRLRDQLPQACLLDIYFSMVHSQIIYLIEAWGTTAKKWWSIVQVLQNQALRAIFNLPALSPRIEMFQKAPHSIVPIKALYELSVAKFVYEVTHKLTISNLKFEIGSGSNATRNFLLSVPRTKRKTLGDRRISVAGSEIYNSFSKEVRVAPSLNIHKKLARTKIRANISNYLP